MTGSTSVTPSPTDADAARLGTTLEGALATAKLSMRQVAELSGVSAMTISRYMRGERVPEPEVLARLLEVLGVPEKRRAALLTVAQKKAAARPARSAANPGRRPRGGGRDTRPGNPLVRLLDYEQTAVRIVDVSPLLVPGLLQTGEYARAIMRAGGAPDSEIETRVKVRIGRRDALMRQRNPARLLALIGEPATCHLIGGAAVMAHQMRTLLQLGAMESVDLRIVPNARNWHPSLERPFVVDELLDGTTVVHLETRSGGEFLTNRDEVARYTSAIDHELDVALSAQDSADLVAAAAGRFGRMCADDEHERDGQRVEEGQPVGSDQQLR